MDVDIDPNDDSRDVEVAPPRARRGRKKMLLTETDEVEGEDNSVPKNKKNKKQKNSETDPNESAPTRALPTRQSKSKAQEEGGSSFSLVPPFLAALMFHSLDDCRS